MIRTARQEFDQILNALHVQAEEGTTAYQVERGLFARLLALGQMLLEVFVTLCAERSAPQAVRSAGETPLRVHSYKSRRYVSIFGETEIERPYFWKKGQAGQFPMDETLSLPADSYSDVLREQADLLSGKMAYGEVSAVIERLDHPRRKRDRLRALVRSSAASGWPSLYRPSRSLGRLQGPAGLVSSEASPF